MELVIYGKYCFLAFHLSSIEGKNAMLPNLTSADAHTHTHLHAFFLSLSCTQKHDFSFSTICDQLNKVGFLIYDHDVNCRIWTPWKASISSILLSTFTVRLISTIWIKHFSVLALVFCYTKLSQELRSPRNGTQELNHKHLL